MPAIVAVSLHVAGFAALLAYDEPGGLDTTVNGTRKATISFDQLGTEAQKQYKGDGIGITPTMNGAKVRAIMQRLEGEATPEGLWLTSTADDDAGKPNRFCLKATVLARSSSSETRHSSFVLPRRGIVRATKDSAVWLRPGVIEEYRVSTDGVRQDFVLPERPPGTGELTVDLEVTGARVEVAGYGAKLTVGATGRELAYSRLHVCDATGKELIAHMEVCSGDRLRVVIKDAGAVYPVRVDPTFSDADWMALNPGAIPGANGEVRAMAVDGGGNLYVGGTFTMIGTVPANRMARWNGSAWSALGSGVNGQINALVVSGNDIVAGGDFTTAGGTGANYIARWNGSGWSALGTGMSGQVIALAVSGGNLYAGGIFTTAGGTGANNIAKWNGTAWSALGLGMNSSVNALAVSGGDLYAGGTFLVAGGTSANYIAKWNGSAWSALGSGTNNYVVALAISGSNLYAGGNFTTAGGTSVNYIAKWNGGTWSALGSGMSSPVYALAVSGSDLCAGGSFITAGGSSTNRIAKWNGSAWSAFGSGFNGAVYALAVSGGNLYAGGPFSTAGGMSASYVAKWNGSAWLGSGTNDDVNALAVSGSDLYVGGWFTAAGGTSANYIAKWNGSTWSALGSGMNSLVNALAVSGSDVYAGGIFTTAGGVSANYIARWNGSAWSALGSGMNGQVFALAVSGSNLYAGGAFTTAGGTSVNRIAKWNGSAWSALGSGMNDGVYALAISGGDLYSGGRFTTAGGIGANRIARWNGSAWSALGSGMNNDVYALAVRGSDLYAAGAFTTAGGTGANYVTRWNGSAWSALGSGMNSYVRALAVSGGDLYAGGGFTTAGGTNANRIAKWNGSAWSGLGSGTDNEVLALATDGMGRLFVGGYFSTAGTTLAPNISQANITSPLATIFGDVVTGSGAPDATGADSGADFDALQRSGYLAQNGNLAFLGYLKTGVGGVDLTNFMGYWKHDGSSLKLLARMGGDAPETGATAAKFNILPLIPGINDDGQVTLMASLLQNGASTPATTADNDVGIWSELGGTGFQILIRENDTIPGLGGPKVDTLGYGCFATAKTSATTGEAAFVVGMKNGSADTALLRTSVVSSDTTQVGVIARENVAAPGGGGETFNLVHGGYTGAVRMDATGNVVFAGWLKPSGKTGIWYQDQATKTVSRTVLAGETAPGTTATFQGIDLPNMGSGGTYAFRAVLNLDGDNADNAKNDGIWKGTATATPTLILRRGDDNTYRPGLFSATYTGAYPNIKAGNIYNGWLTHANHGAWLGWVDLGGDGISAFPYDGNFTASTDTFGIYTDTSGTMTLLIASGDAAPGIAGAKFFFIDHPICGGPERVAFIGTVNGGGTSAGVNDKGVWRTASNGGVLSLVLRTGDTMSTSQGTKTIADVDIPGSKYAEHIWETPVMDGTGRLLVFVTFTDGSTTEVLVP